MCCWPVDAEPPHPQKTKKRKNKISGELSSRQGLILRIRAEGKKEEEKTKRNGLYYDKYSTSRAGVWMRQVTSMLQMIPPSIYFKVLTSRQQHYFILEERERERRRKKIPTNPIHTILHLARLSAAARSHVQYTSVNNHHTILLACLQQVLQAGKQASK